MNSGIPIPVVVKRPFLAFLAACAGCLLFVNSVFPQTTQKPSSDIAALFTAAEAGDAATIKKLLAKKVPVDAPDPDGWTALMVAASAGKLAAVQALVQAGANVNAKSAKGETVLMAAALSGSRPIVEMLLKGGADKSATTAQGLTAAEIARRSKFVELAKLLEPPPAKAAAQAPVSAAAETSRRFDAALGAYEAGRTDEAARLFQEVLALDPRHVFAWHFLGQSLAKKGDTEGAARAYQRVLEIQPTGPVADRTRPLLAATSAKVTRPKLPFEVSEEVLKAIESSEGFACWQNMAVKPVRSRIVERTSYGRERLYLSISEVELTDSGTGYKVFKHFGGDGKKPGTRYVIVSYGGFGVGNNAYHETTGKQVSTDRVTRVVLKGTSCPPRIGAETEVHIERVTELESSRVESFSTSRCRITGKVSASSLHPRLPGDAFVKECRGEGGSKTQGQGSTSHDSQQNTHTGYFLESLGVLLGEFGAHHHQENRSFLPAPGYSYKWNDTTVTFEQVEFELR